MADSTLTAARARESLTYAAETGGFTWKILRSNHVPEGSPAGVLQRNGYVRIQLDGKSYQAHRLAWLIVHGEWPVDQIDHIDGNKSNNRLSNLRAATNGQNQQNQKRAHKGSASGLLGVRWFKNNQKWGAVITVNGQRKHLGLFPEKEQAQAARIAAETELRSFMVRSA